MIYICYDDGYTEITASQFPALAQILNSKNLKFNDEDLSGHLFGKRPVPRKLIGVQLILCELFLSPLQYMAAISEIGAGDNPVLFYKPLNCMIQLRREMALKN